MTHTKTGACGHLTDNWTCFECHEAELVACRNEVEKREVQLCSTLNELENTVELLQDSQKKAEEWMECATAMHTEMRKIISLANSFGPNHPMPESSFVMASMAYEAENVFHRLQEGEGK